MDTVEVAWLDGDGVIVAVNPAWVAFQRANGGSDEACGVGASYLRVSEADDTAASRAIAAAIRAAGRGELIIPLLVRQPCPTAQEERWYNVAVLPRADDGGQPRGAAVVLWPLAGRGGQTTSPDTFDAILLDDDGIASMSDPGAPDRPSELTDPKLRVAVPAPLLLLHNLTNKIWQQQRGSAAHDIVEFVVGILNADAAMLHLLNDDESQLLLVAQHGLPADAMPALSTLPLAKGAGLDHAVVHVTTVGAGLSDQAPGPAPVSPAERIARACHAPSLIAAPLAASHGAVLGLLSATLRADAPQADGLKLWLEQLAQLAASVIEQRRLEEELQRARRQLQLALDAAAAGTWSLKPVDRIVTLDDAAARLLGLGAATALPASQAWRRVAPEDRSAVRQWAQRLATGAGVGSLDVEFRLARTDTEERPQWLRAIGSGQADPHGAVSAMSGILLDITERRRREQDRSELQRLEAVAQLAGGVAHDLNNLLAAIGGNIELATERTVDEEVRRPLERASRAVERGTMFSRRLEALAGRRATVPREIEPGARVLSLARSIARVAGEHLVVRSDIDAQAWRTVADAEQFDAAILHLTANARDAMADGGTLILRVSNERIESLSARSGPDHDAFVCVWAVDDGIGMPPEVLNKVRQRLQTGRQFGADTGLGLNAVQAFAEATGGFLTIDSAPGRGTTVKLFLPSAQAPPPPPPANATRRRARLLLVDDDADVRAVTEELLCSLGFEVDAVPSAAAAMEHIEAGSAVDAVVSDVVMPGGMTGVELAQWVRQRNPRVGLVLYSGYTDRSPGTTVPGVRILRKPLAKAALGAAVNAALSAVSPDPS
ncbi:MAG: response regulator [Acidimicrobiia bacterium]